MAFSLRLREWLLSHFLALLEEADSLGAVEQPTSIPRAYGQYGPDGSFTPRQANLFPRPGQPHTTVKLGARRVALGDTPRYTPPFIPPPRGSPVVVLPLPDQPVTHEGVLEFRPLALDLAGQPQAVVTWLATPIIGDEDGGVSG